MIRPVRISERNQEAGVERNLRHGITGFPSALPPTWQRTAHPSTRGDLFARATEAPARQPPLSVARTGSAEACAAPSSANVVRLARGGSLAYRGSSPSLLPTVARSRRRRRFHGYLP